MDDKQLIAGLKDRLNAAVRKKDVAASLEPFAEDTLMFVLPPPLRFRSGVNAPGGDGVEAWFASFEGEIGLEYREFEITIGGDVAFTHCIEHMSGKRTDGTHTDL